jgi:glyoxylase-like metal-dependent hydrolase (beta-lactamase superfamily II)
MTDNDSPYKIKTIDLPLPFKMGRVNCYLIAFGDSFVLVDTAMAKSRDDLVKELEDSGCTRGKLKLVIVTHADPDHTGNCAYLSETYGVRIALHSAESSSAERGDMTLSRKRKNIFKRILMKMFLLFFRLSKSDRFQPDIYLDEDSDLSDYGFDARVVHIPGHSYGSIGILLPGGELFCGDLLESTKEPALNSIIDDKVTANNSIEKLRSLHITTVYPGHGKTFSMQSFLGNHVLPR